MCVHLGIVWIRTPLFGGWRFRLISKEGKKLIEIREKIYYGITVFLMGLLLGIVMVETHNLLVPIIVHAGVNFYGGIDISFPRRAENQ
jgi:membrane protease YdiL (CAAX protease family)